ncbi:MAG: glycosyltransferase [Oscillospiraceae bacterium]|nr:glycosyltransferase [Oscillospiraceae bacterium]
MPKISIIIPVYNAENYLQKCLKSVVGQTYKDIEIIIINDGSTDGSADICRGYLSDSRVKYFYQENSGPAVAMNYGCSVAHGEYVWFVDADDWIEADAVERLQNETADMVIFNFFRGDSQKHYEQIPDGLYDRCGINRVIFPALLSYIDSEGKVNHIFHNTWMRLYKRTFLVRNNIQFHPSVRNGLDLLFSFEVAVKAETISIRFNDYLYHYIPAANSMTSSYVKNYWERRKEIITMVNELIPCDTLHSQMPLRVFSWVVIGIENELRSRDGSKDIIRTIVQDPVCNLFKEKLDVSGLNEKNQRYYKQICDGDFRGIWKEHQREELRRRKRRFVKKIKKTVKSMLRQESR